MQDFSYALIGITAFFIQLIINGKTMFRKKTKSKADLFYRALAFSLLAYYITDAFWGIFSGLEWTTVLLADTTIYFLAMGSIVVFWYYYIVEYLNQEGKIAKFFKIAGLVFVCLEVIALVVNLFVPIFFWFDEATGAYQTGVVRYIALWAQIAMCVISAITTVQGLVRSKGGQKKRYFAIFFFSIIMLATILLQIAQPLYPVYAFGCLIGSCMLHIYVIEDEREELNKLLEIEKTNAETANKAKSKFLFNMSHDIRTPMNAILGYSNRMIKHIDDKEVVQKSAEKIQFSGEYLLSLINDVLDMARIESDQIKLDEDVYDISGKAHLLCDVFEVDMEKKNLTFIVDFSDVRDNIIWYDSLKLRQVMLNLISNAVKYTPNGGTIIHTMKQLESVKPGYGRYEIVVKDNGIGMSEDFVKHIFERFSRSDDSITRETQGTGLGMSIVKKLIDLMGGTIEVNSEVGKGTEFIVTLDLKIASEEEIRTFKKQQSPFEIGDTLKGMKILLVEDNELNREIATDILESEGIVVKDYAENGVVAIGKIKTSNPGDFDLVLMDIQMPVMDGYEATRQIRALENKELANIPIIAMTANVFDEDKQNAFDAGMNDHVAKPIDVNNLKKAIARLHIR